MNIDKIRIMKPKQRFKMLSTLSKEELYSITDECPGEAHTNPYIDNCMICLNTSWGRVLKK